MNKNILLFTAITVITAFLSACSSMTISESRNDLIRLYNSYDAAVRNIDPAMLDMAREELKQFAKESYDEALSVSDDKKLALYYYYTAVTAARLAQDDSILTYAAEGEKICENEGEKEAEPAKCMIIKVSTPLTVMEIASQRLPILREEAKDADKQGACSEPANEFSKSCPNFEIIKQYCGSFDNLVKLLDNETNLQANTSLPEEYKAAVIDRTQKANNDWKIRYQTFRNARGISVANSVNSPDELFDYFDANQGTLCP